MQDNFAGCPVWSRASEEDDNSEHCCPSPLIIRTLCAFRTEIGTVQTWIMMHRICVCLHTDSMRSVIECRGDWLQLSHLEVESIEENCMSVKCSEPSWLCTKMWISIVFYSSCEFKQWILADVRTISFDSYWIPRSLNRMQKKLCWLPYVIARIKGTW